MDAMTSTAELQTEAGSQEKKKVSNKTMIFYGFGQTGAQLFRDTPASLLPFFMTTMLGVAPWLAGFVILIPKLWLIICDPLMGAFSDHHKPKYGRRPFLVIGAVVTSLSFISLFSFSVFPSPLIAALVIGILFFIASTAFSAFSVPYLAVASELSDDPHERTKILSCRIVFAVIGVVMGVGLAQPLVFMLGGDAAAWRSMAIIFGAICLVAMLVTAYGVPRDLGTAHSVDIKALVTRFSVVKSNKPFVLLTSAFFLQSIAQACGYTVVGFIFIYAVGDINLLLPFILVMACGSIFSQPFWLKLSRRWGKEKAFWLACSGWMLVTVTWIGVNPGDDVLMNLPFLGDVSTQHFLVLLRAVAIGITNAGFSVLTFSMLTDTIEQQRINDGSVDEGIFSGIFSATEKLAFALGPVIAGAILSFTGFESSIGGAVAQTEQATQGMVLTYSIVPAFVMLLSLMIFMQYKNSFVTKA